MKAVVVLSLLLFFLGCVSTPNPPSANCSMDPSVDSFASVRTQDIVTPPAGWNFPTRLGINTDCWEDSANLSPDGQTLYFAQYTGLDLISDAQKGVYSGKIIDYVSAYPFDDAKLHDVVPAPFAIGGVNISGSDMYYHSNQYYVEDGKGDTDIYKNGERLPFNDSEDADDPYYCAPLDELYFWSDKDGGLNTIFVYKDGKVEKLPFPINSGMGEMQPWLTPDCQTMYFASGRINTGNGSPILAIYSSTRTGENSWSEPVLFLSSKLAVAEPTFSDDGRIMTFVQMFKTEQGDLILDVFSMEKANEG